MANQLIFIRRTLYSLAKDYGGSFDLYQFVSEDVDQKTGKRTSQRNRIRIPKAILLPASLSRKFSYDLSFIAANKNFTYGGLYDINTRVVIVESRLLPKGIIFTLDDIITIGQTRLEVQGIEDIAGYGVVLTVKETLGSVPYVIHEQRVQNSLVLEHTIGNE